MTPEEIAESYSKEEIEIALKILEFREKEVDTS